MLNRVFQVVCLELIVFLANVVAPVMGSYVVKGPGTSHDIVYIAPD